MSWLLNPPTHWHFQVDLQLQIAVDMNENREKDIERANTVHLYVKEASSISKETVKIRRHPGQSSRARPSSRNVSILAWPWKCSCVPWERRTGVAKERVWVHMHQSSTNPIREMLRGNGLQRDTATCTHVSSVFVCVRLCVFCQSCASHRQTFNRLDIMPFVYKYTPCVSHRCCNNSTGLPVTVEHKC